MRALDWLKKNYYNTAVDVTHYRLEDGKEGVTKISVPLTDVMEQYAADVKAEQDPESVLPSQY